MVQMLNSSANSVAHGSQMRRLSEKHKRWLERHAALSLRHRLRRRRNSYDMKKREAIVHAISLPRVLSFENNYAETSNCFSGIRSIHLSAIKDTTRKAVHTSRRVPVRLEIDFTTLKNVGPAASLVLAAELDCWRMDHKRPVRVLNIADWDHDVHHLLNEMGLFNLIKVKNPPYLSKSSLKSSHFIPFKSSYGAEGYLARDLRSDLERITGNIPGWQHLYAGLTEAMTNVRQHAYPNEDEDIWSPNTRKWWMCGAYDSDRRLLTCSFYDRGVGIPATVPRTHPMERVREWLGKMGLPENDGSLIAAATDIGRSRTGAAHQGHGLADMKKFIEHSGGGVRGRLRILSKRGKYLYDGHGAGVSEVLPSPLGGTLIEWEIALAERGDEE